MTYKLQYADGLGAKPPDVTIDVKEKTVRRSRSEFALRRIAASTGEPARLRLRKSSGGPDEVNVGEAGRGDAGSKK